MKKKLILFLIITILLPYKIGFVQYGKLYSDLKTIHDPHFKGYVIFLLREKPWIYLRFGWKVSKIAASQFAT